MKTQTYKYITTLCLFLFFISIATAQVEKTKEVHRTFRTNNATLLRIDNRYGEVHIETWDKNQIKLDIVATVRKRSAEQAEDVLEKIEFDISESSSEVSVETQINGSINTGKSENFSIDYKVYMPKANPLKVSNKYGSFYLADFDGKLELEVKYGSMKVMNVSNNALVDLGYGSGEIESLNTGELDISYSKLNVEKLDKMKVYSKYSKVNIEKIGEVVIENKYGDLDIGEANSIEGNIKYGGLRVDKLSKRLVMECRYGSGVNVDWISNKFEMIDLKAGYAGSRLVFEKGFCANFEGRFRYCSLRYPEDDFDFSEIHESSNTSEYRGVLGRASVRNEKNGSAANKPCSKININSEYGNVKVQYEY